MPGGCPAEVARRYDPSTGLLYTWRRMAEGRSPRTAEPVALLPVHIAEPPLSPRGRPPRAAHIDWAAGPPGCLAGSG